MLNIETVSFAFKNKQPDTSNQIISCFYSCYRSLFIKWARITYQSYPADLIEFAANDSFTDGVLKLQESASHGQLYQDKASVKTILFHYCRNMLLGHLTKEKRQTEKNKKLESLFSSETAYHTNDAEDQLKEKRLGNIMLALAKMSAADRQIIQWRQVSEMKFKLADIK